MPDLRPLEFDFHNGGDEESRTPDLLLARQALYQLSYIPTFILRFLISPSKLTSVDELKQYSKLLA